MKTFLDVSFLTSYVLRIVNVFGFLVQTGALNSAIPPQPTQQFSLQIVLSRQPEISETDFLGSQCDVQFPNEIYLYASLN